MIEHHLTLKTTCHVWDEQLFASYHSKSKDIARITNDFRSQTQQRLVFIFLCLSAYDDDNDFDDDNDDAQSPEQQHKFRTL